MRRGGRPKDPSGNLEERTATEDEAEGRAGKPGWRSGNFAVVLPPPWLFGYLRHGQFLA